MTEPTAPSDLTDAAWVVVDVMNVVGSRPDGWWRDRVGACASLVEDLRRDAASSDQVVTAVVDGDASDRLPDGMHGAVEVIHAGRGRDAADDRIVALLQARGANGSCVVTADRDLRERVEHLGAAVVGPATFRTTLDDPEHAPGPP